MTALELNDLRVDDGGVPCVDGLTLTSDAPRTLILGGPRELMRACAGLAPVVRGSIRIGGKEPAAALASGRIAVMQGAAVPPNMTALDYVSWSARLAGIHSKAAATVAQRNLARVGIAGALAKTPLRRQSAFVHRAVQLAAALVPEGATLVLWDPLADLEPSESEALGSALASIFSSTDAIIFAGRAARGGPLVSAAEHVVVLSRGKVLASGSPSELTFGRSEARRFEQAAGFRDAAKQGRVSDGRAFFVRALGDVDRFAKEVERLGGSVTHAAGREELSVELGSMENVDLFRAASAAGAVVVEMWPAHAALS